MARNIERQDVYDYVATTLPYASFDSESEYNIDGIVDTVIASIPDLIGPMAGTAGDVSHGVNSYIDSLIEDEDAYWQTVEQHRIKDADAQVKAAVLAQLQREMAEAAAIITYAEYKAAAAERQLLKLRAEYDRTAAGTEML